MVVPADVHLLHLRVSTWRVGPVSYLALDPRAYHKAQPRKLTEEQAFTRHLL